MKKILLIYWRVRQGLGVLKLSGSFFHIYSVLLEKKKKKKKPCPMLAGDFKSFNH